MICSRLLRLKGVFKANPIVHKDEIMPAKVSGDYKKKTLLPVKAAPADASCSLFLDREVLGLINVMLQEGKKFIAIEVLREVYEIIKDIQLKKYYKAPPDRRHNIITGSRILDF